MIAMMDKRFAEQNVAIAAVVVKTVNGKITNLLSELQDHRKKLGKRMDDQDKKLKTIETTTASAVRLYNGGSTFFRVSTLAGKWLSVMGGAAIILWEALKFAKINILL